MRQKTVCLFMALLLGTSCLAQQSFKQLVGPVTVGDIKDTSRINAGFILFGADMGTFYANGGLTTQKGTLFDKQGLNLNLVPGDDFVQQVRDYMQGKTPFLRGTYRMIGMASEVLNSDARTQPVMIIHLTYSQGDHMVVRSDIGEIKDLKGKKIVFQRPGPHDGLIYDILESGKLRWNDVTVVAAKDLFGTANSPAEMFKKDASIAACCVVTPDMIALTGGLQNTGSGAEGTIKGARVLVSTAELSYSIADVYVCRKDFYTDHRDKVIKFVAGLLKAQEEVIDLKSKYESTGSSEYMKLLKLTQEIYGKDAIPTLEEDAHGLLSDCTFVGLPGNIAFFSNKNSFRGFSAFHDKAMDLAINQGYASSKTKITPPSFDWNSSSFQDYLTKTQDTTSASGRYQAEVLIEEIEELTSGGALDDKTIWSFDINFKPNQVEFAAEQYKSDYDHVIKELNKYGNAVIATRGHACPAKTLQHFIRAAIETGELKRSGSSGTYRYFTRNGKELTLSNTQDVHTMIERISLKPGSEWAPREIMQAALNLSRKRAEAVRKSILDYAKSKGLDIDSTQIQPMGVGVREPLIPVPTRDNADMNRRVEFRLIRVEAEAVSDSDFDF